MATYYVKTGGNDLADGLSDLNAWATIDKVNTFWNAPGFNPDDIICFNRGNRFEGTLEAARSGSAGHTINFMAYGSGAKPIISGFNIISGWVSEGGDIYSKVFAVESNPNMVAIDGVNTPMGRYPSSGWLDIDSYVSNTQITDNDLPGAPDWDGAEVVIRKNHWIIDRNLITNHTGINISYNSASGYTPSGGSGYFIQNHIDTLTYFGAWYYDGSKFYMNFAGTTPGDHVVAVSYLDNNVIINGYDYLYFENIVFEGANISSCEITAGDYINFSSCSFLFSGDMGIDGSAWGASDHLMIDFCTFKDIQNIGIYINDLFTNATIVSNPIENIGLILGMSGSGDGQNYAMRIEGSDHLIQYNQLTNLGYNGIDFKGDNIHVYNNFIDNWATVKDDAGGIYTSAFGGLSFTGIEIKDNIVINGIGAPGGITFEESTNGIYCDQKNSDLTITGNVVYNCAIGAYVKCTQNSTISNNLLCCNREIQAFIHTDSMYPASPCRTITFTYNKLVSKGATIKTMLFDDYLSEADMKLFGTADYNIYARPINDGSPPNRSIRFTIAWFPHNGVDGYYTLPEWRVEMGQDIHSNTNMGGAVADVDDIHFIYNNTGTPVDWLLSVDMNEIDGTVHSAGILSLSGWSGMILLGDGIVTLYSESSPPVSPPYSFETTPPANYSPPIISPPYIYPPAPVPSGSSFLMTIGAIKTLVSLCTEGIYLRWWFNGWHYFNFTNGYEISINTENKGIQVTNYFSIISKSERPTRIISEYSYKVSLEGIKASNVNGFTGILLAERVEQYEGGEWREVEITAGDHPIKDEGTNGFILTFEITRKELPGSSSVYHKRLKLYLGDTLCDMDENEVVPINKQVNDIAEMQDRQSDFTSEFKIRKTRAMKALFELSGEVGANTLFPYQVQECRLIQDGIEVITAGKLILLRVDDQYYYVSIISGNVNFFKLIEGKKLADLTLASMNHTWDVPTMVTTHADTSPETCYVYPLCEPSEDGSIMVPPNDTGDRVDAYGGWIWCFCRVKCIWDEIIANTGFVCPGGELLNEDTFLKLFMPITTREFNNTNEWLFSSWWGGSRLAAINDLLGETDFTGTTLIKGDANFKDGFYYCQYTATYTFRVFVICANLPTLGLYKNAAYQGNMTVVSTDYFFTATYEYKINAAAGDYILILTNSVYYYYWTLSIVKIEAALIDYGSLVDPRNHLPDMTQTEFIKMICNMLGLVPDVTAKDKIIRFWNYQELYDNIPIARDWSCYLSERDDEVEFKYGDYAQENYLKYKESSDVIKDNGQGIMEIDDETLPEKKDVVQSPVSYSDEVTVMTNNFSVDISRIGFNTWNTDTSVYDKNKKIDPRIVYIDHTRETIIPPYWKEFRLRPAVAPGGEVLIMSPKKASSIEISFSTLVINYASLSRLLTKTNLRKAKFNLPVYEVAGLKHNIPIYLRQYKAYFYVNKVNNYVSGQLCTIDLIKL